MNGRELLIGVSGGIAAYKTAGLVSRLVQSGAGVSVVMTCSATRLVGPKTFEALTGRPVAWRPFGHGADELVINLIGYTLKILGLLGCHLAVRRPHVLELAALDH